MAGTPAASKGCGCVNIRTEFVNEKEEDILEENYSEEEEAEFISDEDMDVGY